MNTTSTYYYFLMLDLIKYILIFILKHYLHHDNLRQQDIDLDLHNF